MTFFRKDPRAHFKKHFIIFKIDHAIEQNTNTVLFKKITLSLTIDQCQTSSVCINKCKRLGSVG